MKRLLLIFLLFPLFTFSQKVDTIIVTKIYKSYFSYQTRTPLFVCYKLYKGGGKVSRKGLEFKTGGLFYSATENDYKGNGYDIGHMANAEDFANDKINEELTFRFFNALPQLPKLNRGIWKSLETKLRKQSQTDSLLIICGGFSFDKGIGNIKVPSYCFKIVKSLLNKKINCYLFKNDNSDSDKSIQLNELLNLIPFRNEIQKEL